MPSLSSLWWLCHFAFRIMRQCPALSTNCPLPALTACPDGATCEDAVVGVSAGGGEVRAAIWIEGRRVF